MSRKSSKRRAMLRSDQQRELIAMPDPVAGRGSVAPPAKPAAELPFAQAADGVDAVDADSIRADAVIDTGTAPGAAVGGPGTVHSPEPPADRAAGTVEAIAAAPAACAGAAEAAAVAAAHDSAEPSLARGPAVGLGARLRAAREALGWGPEQVARVTHLPLSVVSEIEADRYAALGPSVYVRGYLRSYARAVGVPEVVVCQAPLEPAVPALQPAAAAAPARHLAARITNAAVYAVMTLAVLVPMVYLVRSQQPVAGAPPLRALDGDAAELVAPIADSARAVGAAMPFADPNGRGPSAPAAASPATPTTPATTEPAAEAPAPSPADGVARREVAQPAAPALPQPMLASMAPVAGPSRALRRVELRLEQASWVELIGRDGRRLERALLPAGSVREYQFAGGADLQIGNTGGASLRIDGVEIDLRPYTRGNVARVSVGVDGGG